MTADDTTYETLKARWSGVLAWSPSVPLWPALALESGYWLDFSKRWESGDKKHAELAQMVFRFGNFEDDAKAHGYKPKDESPIPYTPSGPDLTDKIGGGIYKKTSTYNPQTGELLSETESGIVGDIKKRLPTADPLFAPKAAALGALAVGTVAGAAFARSDASRIGIAAGGALVTAAAGWFMFAPSKEPKK